MTTRTPSCPFDFARSLLPHLGTGWTVTPDPVWPTLYARLTDEDEQGVTVRLIESGDVHRVHRYAVDAYYPAGLCARDIPRITFAVDRDRAQVARRITTRFLPAYRTAYAQATERRDEAERVRTRRADIARHLSDALPGLTPDLHQQREGSEIGMHLKGTYGFAITIGFDETVTLALTARPDVIARLCAAYAETATNAVDPQ